ncbi:hypothetical protein D3C81_1142260 [compost metagenome]
MRSIHLPTKKATIAATAPITIEAHASTKAQEPVIATNAASTPFSMLGISDLPITAHEINNAAIAPAAAARFVVINT